jgi:hypothetical protein
MTIPSRLRLVQQSYLTHIAVAATIAGGGGASACFGTSNTFTLTF